MQTNKLANDVITETPATERKPVLTFARCNIFEFPDVMRPSPVIGIFGEDDGSTAFS